MVKSMSLLNRPRATRLMEEHHLDAIIATTPEHVLYTSGIYSFAQWYRRAVQAFAVFGRDPAAATAVVLPLIDAHQASSPDGTIVVVPYGPFPYAAADAAALRAPDRRLVDWSRDVAATPLEALVTAIDALGLGSGRLGVDTARLWPMRLDELAAALPGATLDDAYPLLQQVRMVKTSAEVELLRGAARATEQAFLASLATLREGVMERDVARAFESALAAQGARPSLTTIAFDEHGAYPTAQAGERRLRAGTVVRYDIGCRYEGYYADMARIAVVGTPTDRVRTYYQALRDGAEAALGAIRPGVTTAQLFRRAVETVQAGGIPHYERPHVGHGIGLEPYDLPSLSPGEKDTAVALEPGMVINVETPYYEVGSWGLQVEDTVVVTEQGYEPLTTISRDLYVV